MDVTTLKPFRQSACQDPVAIQVLTIAKLQKGNAPSSSSSSPNPRNFDRQRYPPKKEQYASTVPPRAKGGGFKDRRGARPPPFGDSLSKLENVTALPHKDGRLDMEAYSKYKEEVSDAKSTMRSERRNASDAFRRVISARLARNPPSRGRKTSIKEKILSGNPNKHALNGSSIRRSSITLAPPHAAR